MRERYALNYSQIIQQLLYSNVLIKIFGEPVHVRPAILGYLFSYTQ